MKYVIIGNSTAAVGGIEGIRRLDADTPIVVVSDEPYHVYSRPLISYYLGGKIPEEAMFCRGKSFYKENKVEPLLGVKAVSVDPANKAVNLEDGSSVTYSKLLIATGGKPLVPKIQGLEKENVFNFLKLDDAKAISKIARKGSKAIVAGAGFSGLKAVEALVWRGVDVTVIDIMDRIMPRVFDECASSIVEKKLRQMGVNVLLGAMVESITGCGRAEAVSLKGGAELACDFIVLAIGIRCNFDLAAGAGIKTNRGIIVDERMRTNLKDIYAAGDAAEGYNFLEDRRCEIPTLPNAYKQGEIAGINMAGGQMTYSKAFPVNSLPIFEMPVACAGITEEGNGVLARVLARPDDGVYKKFFIKENRLVGYLLINDIERAGIYTELIRDGTDVSAFMDNLGRDGFGLASFPEEIRKKKMLA